MECEELTASTANDVLVHRDGGATDASADPGAIGACIRRPVGGGALSARLLILQEARPAAGEYAGTFAPCQDIRRDSLRSRAVPHHTHSWMVPAVATAHERAHEAVFS